MPSDGGGTVKRRGLLRLGTLASAITGAFALSGLGDNRALGAPPISDKELSATYAVKANNLSDLISASTARTNLGLGDAATHLVSDFAPATLGGKLPVRKDELFFHVKDYGAVGDWDGTTGTDDTAAVNAAITAAYNAGGGTVRFDRKAYCVTRKDPAEQKGGGLFVKPRVNLDGNGATLVLRGNTEFIYASSTATLIGTITADTLVTDTTVTVDTTAGLSVGDEVFVRLGTSAYDANEPKTWLFATVTALMSTSLTVDRPLGYALSVAGTTNAALRTVHKVTDRIQDISIKNFMLNNPMTGGANAESGIRLLFARRVTIDKITASNPGAGAIYAQYCDDLNIPSVSVTASAAQGGQTSKGRAVNFAECRNVWIGSLFAKSFERIPVLVEAASENVVIANARFVNDHPTRSTSNMELVGQLGNRSITVQNLMLEGKTSVIGGKGVTGEGTATYGNLTALTDDDPTIPILGEVQGEMNIRGAVYGEIRRHTVEFRLLASQPQKIIPLPLGRIRHVRAFASTLTGLTGLYVSRDSSSNGTNQLSKLVAGQTVDLSGGVAGLGSVYPLNSNDNKRLLYSTDATVPAGAHMTVEVEYFVSKAGTPSRSAASVTAFYDRIGLQSPPALPPAATDAATTQKLVNALRQALIDIGAGA